MPQHLQADQKRSRLLTVAACGLALFTSGGVAASPVSDQEMARAYVSPKYVSARLVDQYLLVSRLFQLMELGKIPGGRPQEGTFSDENLKMISSEFIKINIRFRASVEKTLSIEEVLLNKSFAYAFVEKPELQDAVQFFRDDRTAAWAEKNSEFLAEALPISQVVSMIVILSPNKYAALTHSDVSDLDLESGGMAKVVNYHHIRTALSDEQISVFLPSSIDLSSLRAAENRLRLTAKEIFSDPQTQQYQRALGGGISQTLEHIGQKIWLSLQPYRLLAENELTLLAQRADYAANPLLTGACDSIKERLDPQSIKNANGNWSLVADSAGVPIEAASDAMPILAKAYIRGCYVSQSTRIARGIIEQWASAHHDSGKKAAYSHCMLAQWYRYGIGGKPDSAKANYWEKRLGVDSAGEASCRYYFQKPVIDPSDPWKKF